MAPSRLRFLIGLSLVAATFLVYRPVAGYSFVNLDDPDYVQDNPIVSSGPTRAFTEIHAGYWIPLTWLSYQLDYHLYGLAAGGYHATNLLLHSANAVLLFLLLCRWTEATWPSAFAAALFALHPLQVESVAWITERKDVLSTLLGLLALHAYTSYARQPSIAGYLLVALWFALSLMAKPMLVTLPCVLLLLDFWPLNRLCVGWVESSRPTNQPNAQAKDQIGGSRRLDPPYASSRIVHRAGALLLEKLPLFALACVASIITVIAQRQGDAVRSLDEFPLTARLGNALVSYERYLEMLFWPFNLAVFYPHPGLPSIGQMFAAALVLGSITGFAIHYVRSRPYLLVGWLWFVGTLFPVCGIVQAGWQGMADRFLYVPTIGLFIMFAFAVHDLGHFYNPRSAIRHLQSAISIAILVLLSLRAANQVCQWQNSITLWEHSRQVTPDNFYTRFSYGAALLDAGRIDEAAANFEHAVQLKPDHPFGHYELGLARLAQGRRDEAAACWITTLRLAPHYTEARQQLDLLRQ
jgi:tetratricopeptide (TPR) repeat protein